MTDFDSLVAEVLEEEKTDAQEHAQAVLSVYNAEMASSLGHKLKMIAWDQK